jgi:hypothetical protein
LFAALASSAVWTVRLASTTQPNFKTLRWAADKRDRQSRLARLAAGKDLHLGHFDGMEPSGTMPDRAVAPPHSWTKERAPQ